MAKTLFLPLQEKNKSFISQVSYSNVLLLYYYYYYYSWLLLRYYVCTFSTYICKIKIISYLLKYFI